MRVSHLFLGVWLLLSAAAGWAVPEGFRTAAGGFAAEMAEKHGFDDAALTALMAQARFRQSIIDAMTRPAESKPWHKYRPIFLTRERADGGVAFWQANQATLARAEREYGVPPQIIVAIIGVETKYGRITGSYPVLDALSTLAFAYPRRSKFFRKELEQYLLLTREEGVDPLMPKGSYAGAMGKPQFMPSSYRAYAIDFDGDGKRDIWHNDADAIGSVANYLKRHGWKPGASVTHAARARGEVPRRFEAKGMKPSLRVAELSRAGLTPVTPLAPETRASLVRLDTPTGAEYWFGLNNFYVITRYNRSNLYAMAVYQLSEEIKAGKQARDEELASLTH